MIKVDISNIWGELSLPDLLAAEKEVFNAHMLLTEKNGPGNDFLGWLDLPVEEQTEEICRIDGLAGFGQKSRRSATKLMVGGGITKAVHRLRHFGARGSG